MKQSVIVSTYDKPWHLRLVLAGLSRQTTDGFEVLVADDGSGPETADLIRRLRPALPFPLEHVWQEDRGFRAARIRNLGVKESRGEQLVFLDGDCVPWPGFLACHLRRFAPRTVLVGDRLYLDEPTAARLRIEDVTAENLPRVTPLSEQRALRRRGRKNAFYRLIGSSTRPPLVTANVSLSRSAYEDVNGLDERFVGWGSEDTDLRRRLRRRGYSFRSLATTARVSHVWHPHVDSHPGRVRFGANIDYLRRGYFLSRCRRGLRTRPLSEIRIAWNGEPPAGDDPVELAISGERAPTLAAEVQVRVVGAAAPTGLKPRPQIWVLAGSADPDPPPREPWVRVPPFTDTTSASGRRTILSALDDLI